MTQPARVSTATILPFPGRREDADRALALTARVVDTLAYSRNDLKLQFVWDAKMVGLGVRLTPAGHKAYVVRYRVNGRQRPGSPSFTSTICAVRSGVGWVPAAAPPK